MVGRMAMTSALIDPYEEGWPPGVKPPPRGCDLPCDDGEPMETADHRHQMNLLIEVFLVALERMGREDVFVGGNMALYYSALQAKKNDFKAPDVFVVLDTTFGQGRKSWVVWEEDGRTPSVVVELLSESTEANDRGPKRRIYERILRVPDYFIYDPIDFRFEGWHLEEGVYQPLLPDSDGRLFCATVGLWLGRWRGSFLKRETSWLRLFDADGRVVPTYGEAAKEHADAAIERADAAIERADAATERADAEAMRADAEAERARAAEARVAELLAQLGRDR